MAINREISQFSNFVSVDDNTKKVSISTSFDIGGDSVISGIATFRGNVNIGTAATTVDLPGLYLKGNNATTNFFQNPSISIGGTTNGKYYDTFLVDAPNIQYVRHWANGFDINFSVSDDRLFVVSNIDGASSVSPAGVVDGHIAFKINPETSTELRYNKSTKLETTGYGVTVTGGLNVSGISTFQDNIGISSGKSIQHIAEPQFNDNAHRAILSYGSIESTPSGNGGDFYREYAFHHNAGAGTTGTYYQRVNNNIDYEIGIDLDGKFAIGNHNQRPLHSDYTSFEVVQDGETKLYYNYTKKLETTGYGVSITGGLNVSGITTAQLFSGNGGSLTNLSAYDSYKSDISERAFKTDEISGSLVYAPDGQRFSNQGTGTGSVNSFAIYSVISKDGKVAYVSEYDDQSKQLGTGRIHIYERTGANFTAIGIVTQTSHSSPGAAQTTTCFGPIIACNADGSIFAVGSPQGIEHGAGGSTASFFSWWHYPAGPGQQSVHIFQKNGSTITNIGILTSPSPGNLSNGDDSFGGALAFSDDGSKLYVGSPRRGDNVNGNVDGAIFVYDKSGSTYNYVGIITSPNMNQLSGGAPSMGQALACSSDGNILFSGWPTAFRRKNGSTTTSHYSGAVEIYDRLGSNFNNVGIVSAGHFSSTGNALGVDFGEQLACSDDGTYLYAISRQNGTDPQAYPNGKLHLFKRELNVYSEVSSNILDSVNANNNTLGWGLACSSDGSKVITGECNITAAGIGITGFVQYYARVGDNITRIGFSTAGAAQGGGFQIAAFGQSLDLSGSGEVAIVGAPSQPYVGLGGGGAAFFLEETRGTAVYSDIVTGNIGIKSDSPKATLDINGTLNVGSPAATTGITTSFKVQDGNAYLAVEFSGSGNTRAPYVASNGGSGGVYLSGDSDFAFTNYAGNELYLQFERSSGRVNLAHGTGATYSTRLSTREYGIDVTGRVETDTLNVSGISTFQDDVNVGTGGTVAFFDISAGRVGIGSTTPTKVLDVGGTLGVSGASVFTSNVRISPSSTNQTALSFDTELNPGGFITPGISFNMTNTSRYGIYNYYNNTDGYAYHKLASNSNFEIGLDQGSFIVGDNGAVPISSKSFEVKDDAETYLTHNKNKKLETTGYGVTVTGGLNVSGITTIGNYLNIGGSDISISSTTINGDQAITFDGTAGNLFTLTDNLTTGNLFAVNDVSGFSVFEVDVDGTTRMGLATNDKVGIGSTQPTAKLDVDGTLNVSGVSTFRDRVIFDSTNSIQIPVGTDAEKDAVGTAVTGQIRYNTTNSQFEGFGPGNDWGSLGGVKDVDGDTYIKPESSPGSDEDALTFFTGGTERAVIDSDGKVGIGTTNPTATLDVDGTLNVSGVSTLNSLRVSGSSRFDSDLEIVGGELDVSGEFTTQSNLNVGGFVKQELHTPEMPVGLNADIGEQWTKIEMGSAIERIKALVYCGDGIVLAGSSGGTSSGDGDIYRSTDYGQTWIKIEMGSTIDSIRSLVYCGNGIVFAGDGEGDIWKSTDFGLTWNTSTSTTASSIVSLVYCGDGIVIAGGSFGSGGGDVWRSTDFGANWTNNTVSSDLESIYSLVYIGNGDVLAGGGDEGGYISVGNYQDGDGDIYKSGDYGQTWTKIEPGTYNKYILSLVYCGDGVVLAGAGIDAIDHSGDNTYNGDIYRSTDWGNTWTRIELDISLDQIPSLVYCGNGIVLAGSGADTNTGDIWKSDNYGQTWTKIEMGSSLETISSLVYCGNGIVLAGSGNGSGEGDIYRSDVGFSQASTIQGIYHEHLTGNIGIGSTQPIAKLDVNGALNVSGVSTFQDDVNIGTGGTVAVFDVSSGNVGIGSTIPAYTLDLGESPSTIRLVSDDGGTAIRMGAGDQNHDFTILRVDGAISQHDGETDSQAYGFSLRYIGSPTGNNNKLRIVADNQTGTPINAFTMLQDGSVGINSMNPTATLDVNGSVAIKNHSIVSITTSHTASAGTPFTIDTFATSENDLAEYTIHVGYGNTIQAQKVLVMHDGTTAYSQEYAVMHNPSKIVSIEAFISGSNILLRATPETGVSGITTYKIVRGGLV